MPTLYNRIQGHNLERLAALADGFICAHPYFRRARQNELTLRYRNSSISAVAMRNFG
jgi:hypothetical protein